MPRKETHIVPVLSAPMRLSDYAGGVFAAIPSRKGMKKAIDRGSVLLNGSKANTGDYVSGGETLELLLDENPASRPTIDLKLEVLLEDDHLAAINKPAGIEVSGNRKWTVENALHGNLKPSTATDALTYPEAIHRLDYPTTGVLLVGKTRTAIAALNELFAKRLVTKGYLAITIGEMAKEGVIETPIDGKPSKSSYTVVDSVASERFGRLNLVSLEPHTGRKHQLRKHMASIGCPILGDKDYGLDGLILKGKGLYLHASALTFTHSETGMEHNIQAPIPKKFLKIFPNSA